MPIRDPIWDTQECPGCGASVPIHLMSLCATCCWCGLFFADTLEPKWRGWYSSREAYYNSVPKLAMEMPRHPL